jgi:chemotaxis protein histidine kinase CheA/ActR/RegA family two-component response regulator
LELGNDAELLAIFREEVAQRSENLVDGSTAMATGRLDADRFSTLFRDAHTIKGSSRVMGFVEMGEAARILEAAWRDISEGVLQPGPELGDLLRAVAAEFLGAMDEGTNGRPAGLQAAVGALESFLGAPEEAPTRPGPPPPADASAPAPAESAPPPPVPPPSPAPSRPVPEMGSPELLDLGGLLSSVESGLVGPATRVETTRLYRLINRAAEVRLDAAALAAAVQALRFAVSSNPREVAALATSWESAVETLDLAVEDLQMRALQLVAAPLSEITATFHQFVRYVSRRTGKQIRFELAGDDVEVDRQIIEHLREPLRHLLVNAIDHGVETPDVREAAGKPATASLAVRAQVTKNSLVITVEDDGRGIDWMAVRESAREQGLVSDGDTPSESELTRLLYGGGFSTSIEATDLSGDGAGLALVAETAEMLNGGISVESRPGHGTSVMLTLPASWALQDMLLISAEERQWGIPAAAVVAAFALSGAEVRPGKDRMELVHQGQRLPISSFASAVGLPEKEPVNEVIVLATRSGLIAVTVPGVVGRRQVAVKGLGPVLAGNPHLTGAAVLGGGEVVVVIEPNRLGDRVRSLPNPVVSRPRVLVVDDSAGARQLVGSVLTGQGFETLVAADAEEGLAKLKSESFDALVVDYAMPGSDGVELVQAVRDILPSLPVVMVSAVAKEDDQARAWSVGVDAYLDKADLRQGLLATTLNSLLEMRTVAQPDDRSEVNR